MSRVGILRTALALVVWTGLAGLALADDWMVDRLRGEVLVMSNGSWLPLQRGDIVSDSSRIRSVEGSRVTFTRGAEAIELSGATEIRIFDQQGQRMTTIMQAYGTVTIEAERLQIQHFSVQTPFLAAIVKGTRFTVHSDDAQSSVDVSRGLVQVQDYTHGVATDIMPGQTAVVSNDIMLDVSGSGPHAPMVTLDGALVAQTDEQSTQADGQAMPMDNGHGKGHGNAHGQDNAGSENGQGNGNSGNGNGNGNGNSESSNSGNGNSGNGNGNSGNGNGNSGNGNGNSGNGNGNSGNGNGGDAKSSNGQGNNGNHGNGNNGNGQGNGSKKDD